MHLDADRSQRLLHGELGSAEASLRAHLGTCTECAARFARAEQEEHELYALLGQLDHAPPALDAAFITDARHRSYRSWLRRAAAIALSLGLAAGAYALPGSPLPRALARLTAWLSRADATVEPSRPTPLPRTTGISVDPGAALTIQFTSAQPSGEARVTLTSASTVTVRAIGGAASFNTDIDRLVIENEQSTSDYDIDIPRAAPRVEIRIGGHTVLLKEGTRIVTAAQRRADGGYRVVF